jgi:hypothetical protein
MAAKCDSADTGKFAHSFFLDVQLRPWFEGRKEMRKFVCTVLRVLYDLYGLFCSIASW